MSVTREGDFYILTYENNQIVNIHRKDIIFVILDLIHIYSHSETSPTPFGLVEKEVDKLVFFKKDFLKSSELVDIILRFTSLLCKYYYLDIQGEILNIVKNKD